MSLRALASCLLALSVSMLAPAAVGAELRSPAHAVSLATGVPIPLRVYGGDASLNGLELRLLLRLQLAYELSPAARLPRLTIGARSSLSLVAVSDGELTMWGWAALLGPQLGARLELSQAPRVELRAGVGPALARSGFRIDRELRRDFWAPAGFAFVTTSLSLGACWSLALDLTLEHVRAAPRDQEFVNRRLGSTTLLAVSLAVFAHF